MWSLLRARRSAIRKCRRNSCCKRLPALPLGTDEKAPFLDDMMRKLLAPVAFAACFVVSCRSSRAPIATFQSTEPITISYSDTVGILRYEWHPMIRASINGVSGQFIVDTGATIPLLGIEAARRCKFEAFWPPVGDETNQFWGEKIRMMKATNLVVELARGLTVHWPEVLVTGETNFFGIIDYRTLKTVNAVIDTRRKTITFSK